MSTLEVIHFAFWFTITAVGTLGGLAVIWAVLLHWIDLIERKQRRILNTKTEAAAAEWILNNPDQRSDQSFIDAMNK